jgi:electron transport complex protein RnfC
MKRARTFLHGGIDLPEKKRIPGAIPADNAFLPNAAIVPMKQNSGPPARCVVRRGEYIREGMVIGRAETRFTANVHAPVPGIVREIRRLILPDGGESEAVVIALEGRFDRLGKREDRYLWRSMARLDILHALRERGVVETESPGRPLFDILIDREKTELLVLNAIESEPFLQAEARMLEDRCAVVLDGLEIVRKVLDPERTIVAVGSEEQGKAILAQLSAFGGTVGQGGERAQHIEILLASSRYPQDLPRQLIAALEGKKIPDRFVMIRPTTAFAVHEAVVLAKPMVERYVTVGGGAVKWPAVLKARIGTPIGDLIEECGGFSGPPSRMVVGGPLRGVAVHDLDVPLTKTTAAILALTKEEIGFPKESACIRCGRCAEVCPERLDPELLYRLISFSRVCEAEGQGLGECTLCGACGYVCPSRVQLVAAFASRTRDRRAANSEGSRT